MEIQINKELVWKRILVGESISLVSWLLSFYLLYLFFNWFVSLNDFTGDSIIIPQKYFILTSSAIVLVWIINLIIRKIWLNSLLYEVEEHTLTKISKVITKNRDQARLQVINDVTISQSIISSFFKLFSLTVDYGFSNDGYKFTLDYLTEEQAQDISKLIKPTGSPIHIK